MGVPVHGDDVQPGKVEAVPPGTEMTFVGGGVRHVREVVVRGEHRLVAAIHVIVVSGNRMNRKGARFESLDQSFVLIGDSGVHEVAGEEDRLRVGHSRRERTQECGELVRQATFRVHRAPFTFRIFRHATGNAQVRVGEMHDFERQALLSFHEVEIDGSGRGGKPPAGSGEPFGAGDEDESSSLRQRVGAVVVGADGVLSIGDDHSGKADSVGATDCSMHVCCTLH